MPGNAAGAAMSLMLKKGFDRRKEDEMLKAFREADKDGDGFLSVEEYIHVFKNHGIEVTQEEVISFFNIKDRDRDGRISFDEFCDRETVNEKAFKAMDINQDGFITKAEMLKASSRSSRRLSANDVDACFKEYDRDRDNKLNYDEFCVMMNSRRSTLDVLEIPRSPAHRRNSNNNQSASAGGSGGPNSRRNSSLDTVDDDDTSVSLDVRSTCTVQTEVD